MLTGKCKEQFEFWYDNNMEVLDHYGTEVKTNTDLYEDYFVDLPTSMKIGIYMDFFDTLGYTIGRGADGTYFVNPDKIEGWYRSDCFRLTREEVILKANSLYND